MFGFQYVLEVSDRYVELFEGVEHLGEVDDVPRLYYRLLLLLNLPCQPNDILKMDTE